MFTNPNYIEPRNEVAFRAYMERKFGEEMAGVSPQAYGWIVEAWNHSADIERGACAEICRRIESLEWNDFKGRYFGEHPRPEKQGSSYVEGKSDGAGECAQNIEDRT